MNRYKLKFTKLQNEIFRLFSIKSSSHLTKRAIARALNVSPTGVAKALPLLEKEGLIKVEKSKEMNLSSVRLDRDSSKAIEAKKIENLKLIYESDLIQFLEESFPGTTIILFGSYARGEDTEESDIDLFIESEKVEISLEKFEKKLKRTIQLHYKRKFKDMPKELKNNIMNGIVLDGYVVGFE